MKNISKTAFILLLSFILSSCQSKQMPEIVPGIEVKRSNTHVLGTIGEVEPVYVTPIEAPFPARIDTGAETSAIDAKNVKTFERDGEEWVSFTIKHRETGEVRKFEKPIDRKYIVKRIIEDEKRYVVKMEVKMGNQVINEDFSLANREKFDYQVLVGRNILKGRAIVDTSLMNTLH